MYFNGLNQNKLFGIIFCNPLWMLIFCYPVNNIKLVVTISSVISKGTLPKINWRLLHELLPTCKINDWSRWVTPGPIILHNAWNIQTLWRSKETQVFFLDEHGVGTVWNTWWVVPTQNWLLASQTFWVYSLNLVSIQSLSRQLQL